MTRFTIATYGPCCRCGEMPETGKPVEVKR